MLKIWIGTLFPFFIVLQSFGATSFYLDATGGSNTAAGTSLAAPWKTLARVATAPNIANGDTIYLKRGEIWAESLRCATQVTVDAYSGSSLPIPLISKGIDVSTGNVTLKNLQISGPIYAVTVHNATNFLMSRCEIIGSSNIGVYINTPGSYTYANMYYNIIRDCTIGIHINGTAGDISKLYNNTIQSATAIYIQESTASVHIRNNILIAPCGIYTATLAAAYNMNFNFFNSYYYDYHNSFYTTFSGWKTVSSQDANSIGNVTDPFVYHSTTPYNFHLQSRSACIGAATQPNVVLGTDFEGNIVPQHDTWDIGALEYVWPRAIITDPIQPIPVGEFLGAGSSRAILAVSSELIAATDTLAIGITKIWAISTFLRSATSEVILRDCIWQPDNPMPKPIFDRLGTDTSTYFMEFYRPLYTVSGLVLEVTNGDVTVYYTKIP